MEFKKFERKVNKMHCLNLKYECLKQNDLFSTIKINTISNDTITVFFHNARKFSKHMNDTVRDDRVMNNDI